MTHKKFNLITGSLMAGVTLVAGGLFPAFAQGIYGSVSASVSASSSLGGGTGAGANVQITLIARAKERADQEIDRRTKALNALEARIQSMKKLSDSEKSSLSATIQAQLAEMASLKAKIDADTDLTTLRADVQSITKSYRIFALIIPQGAIIAAADRAITMVGNANTLSAKLQARISSAQAAGNDMSASVSALADFNAKIADANIQAQAAVSEVSSLTPDNDDQAKFQANLAAMKDARSKIQAAQQDFVAARKDAGAIVRVFMELKIEAHASSTASSTP